MNLKHVYIVRKIPPIARGTQTPYIRFEVILQSALQDKGLQTMAFRGLFGVWIAKVLVRHCGELRNCEVSWWTNLAEA